MSKDDTAVNDEVVAESTPTESAPVENKPEVAESSNPELSDDDFGDDELDLSDVAEDDEDEADKSDDKAEQTPEAVEDKAEEQPQGDKPVSPEDEWNALKGNSQERFRNAINERNEAQRRIAELEAQQAQFATEQELLNETDEYGNPLYTPEEIERQSWQQGRQAQAERQSQELYQLQVQQNQVATEDEVIRATEEFSLLNPGSTDYVPEIAAEYGELLNDNLVYAMPDGQQYTRTTLLQNNVNPDTQATLVGFNTSPYKLAKSIAKSYAGAKAQGETIGQANAQRATEQMLANADAPSSAHQSKSKDSDLDDFDAGWKD